ncbi:MAG: sulfotransferase [Gemmatimonadales bacterium]
MPPAVEWSHSGSRLILLLSSPRSGSTLLRVVLGGHSRVVAPAELFLLLFPDFDTWRRERPLAIRSLVEIFELIGIPRPRADIEAACRGKPIEEVYHWLLASLPADTALLDKTPAYATDPAVLERSRAWDPFYIWLVRHPLGSIDSFIRLKQQELFWPFGLARRLKDGLQARLFGGMSRRARRREDLWVRQNRTIRDFLATVPPERKHALRFEDLLYNPAETLGMLCGQMGLVPEEGMLERAGRQIVRGGLGDPNFHRHDGISTAPALNWRTRYDESILSARARDLVREIWRRSRAD